MGPDEKEWKDMTERERNYWLRGMTEGMEVVAHSMLGAAGAKVFVVELKKEFAERFPDLGEK